MSPRGTTDDAPQIAACRRERLKSASQPTEDFHRGTRVLPMGNDRSDEVSFSN